MARTHARSPTPEEDGPTMIKRLKSVHVSSSSDPRVLQDPTPCFATNLFDPANIQRLHASYKSSEPFKYTLVEKLFQDDLLLNVKDECLSELHFTEKETDIYKVNQTGDLASLSFLTESQIALLPNILKLRDALYSSTFRTFLQKVTGCGALSGIKQDMSVNTYKKGCHLLNHDDVIGTRRVSYILYMPLPHYQLWQKDWGGALELYPVREGPDGVLEPEPVPTKSVPPSWNQFIFFEVQPGRSFHSVEEVVVGEGEDGRQRLSISGWFHAAQEGEEGYEPEAPSEYKSSRDQLASTATVFKSYADTQVSPLPDEQLTEDHISFLSEFLNPVYLQYRTMKALASRFVEESSLELHDFLCRPIAERLRTGLREIDVRDGLSESREGRVPPHSAGSGSGWLTKGPPHKWRYNVLEPAKEGGPSEAVSPRAAQAPDGIIRSLQDELFTSAAFRAWLAIISRLLPIRHAVEARRFRPGLDYTLATSEAKEARLDVVLGLTPQVGGQREESDKGRRKDTEEEEEEEHEACGWETGEWGGWECYMAPHDEEDDPAVYRSGSRKKENGTNGNGHINGNGAANGNGAQNGDSRQSPNSDVRMDDATEGSDEEDDDDDDGTLLTVQPGFNRLLIVLRDEGVMHFVKYVSAAAQGSRWDVCGEYEVGLVEEDDEA